MPQEEGTPLPESGENPQTTEELRRQADRMRDLSGQSRFRKTPGWVKGVYVLAMLVALAGSISLLVSRDLRVRTLLSAGRLWNRFHAPQELAEIYTLPAPPPKKVEPRIVYQGVPTTAYRVPAQDDDAPASSEGNQETRLPELTGVPTGQEPSPVPRAQGDVKGAYQVLLQKSETARKLSSDVFPDFRFQDWAAAKSDPPEYYINISARRVKDGKILSFIWSINTESGKSRPLSQDARDLEGVSR